MSQELHYQYMLTERRVTPEAYIESLFQSIMGILRAPSLVGLFLAMFFNALSAGNYLTLCQLFSIYMQYVIAGLLPTQ